ncbi:MAG TPA: metallopeptidase TldD-related protein [Mycobacteriales bacterium]|nr:metallopeptidase TldD-related protein [Mycobacteriales bacterium]
MSASGAHVVERVLALSRADGCIALCSESSTVDLRWANSTLTTNGSRRGRHLTVISVVGQSVGVRSASVLDDLEALVRGSEQAARESGQDEDYAPLVEGAADDSFTDPAEATTTEVFAQLARDLGEAFRGDVRQYGFATHDLTTTWLASSTGLRRRHVQPTGYVEMTAKNDARGGSSWVGQHSHDFANLSVPALDAELRRRLSWTKRFVELPKGRYETLLPPTAVADLMVDAYWYGAGRDAHEGRTVYSRPNGGTRVGEVLAPRGFSLRSDPTDPGLAIQPFVTAGGSSDMVSVFDNGHPLPATSWIEDGTLRALPHTRASAAQYGDPFTPYVDNLVADGGGTASLDEMVASTERGLLLTCLWYIRVVDPESLLLTGLTRDGVYLVEDGEVTGVVNNFRWNESPVDLLGRIAECGVSVPTLPREWSDYFTWARMPALRIPDFNMSSVSPAS